MKPNSTTFAEMSKLYLFLHLFLALFNVGRGLTPLKIEIEKGYITVDSSRTQTKCCEKFQSNPSNSLGGISRHKHSLNVENDTTVLRRIHDDDDDDDNENNANNNNNNNNNIDNNNNNNNNDNNNNNCNLTVT